MHLRQASAVPWQLVYADGPHHGQVALGVTNHADPAEIVRIINAHAALVKACEAALVRHKLALAIRVKMTGIKTGALADEIAQLEAALALAKTKETPC